MARLLDETSYDEALKQLAVEPPAPFAARYADVRGDIYAAQGKPAEAAKMYDDALAKIDAAAKVEEVARHQAYRDLVQTKRDALGVAQ